MKLAQCPIRCIIHHQERGSSFNPKIENTNDMRMSKTNQCSRFRTKSMNILTSQLTVQDFDGSLGLQVNMLTQVDLCKTTPAKQACNLIIAKLLSYTIEPCACIFCSLLISFDGYFLQ